MVGVTAGIEPVAFHPASLFRALAAVSGAFHHAEIAACMVTPPTSI